ncbi:MAG TPA: sugar phosphate isomerase/epimerase [Caldilineaceae bacterium]|nr:sugar phosphate isomerase/epimerase [Caldilineaceae bacterium]
MPTVTSTLPLAVQLYTLRNLPDPLDTVLGQVAAAGYRGVETVGDHGMTAEALRDLLAKHNLQAVSAHVGLPKLEGDFDGVAAFNRTIGNLTLVIPALPQDMRPTDAEGWRQIGRRLEELAQRAFNAGLHLLYHNHAWEMEPMEGKTALDWLLEAAPHLGWEPDLAWIVRGAADPLPLLERYTGRCARIHVKDLAPAGQGEAEKGFADVGYGTLDWATLLPAAKAAGGEWFIVEHDWPQDAIRTIQRSHDFLQGLLATQ